MTTKTPNPQTLRTFVGTATSFEELSRELHRWADKEQPIYPQDIRLIADAIRRLDDPVVIR